MILFSITTLTGCQAVGFSPSAIPVFVTAQASPERREGENTNVLSAEPMGRLAYIAADGNIYVTTADRSSTMAITDDATASPEGQGMSYHRVSWSPDGWLAFAAVTRSNGTASSKLYVTGSPGGEPAQIVGQSDEHFVIYIYWSPASCPDRATCRRLAYLIEEDDSISLRLVDMEGGQIENRQVGMGGPFYFSWRPDGRQMVWHTGGAGRYNRDARLALHDVERNLVRTLPQMPGLFLAPVWSPQGDRWLGVVADETMDQLQSFPLAGLRAGGVDQPVTLAAASNSQVVFSWSPDGNRVAYAMRQNSNDPFYGPIHVFDLNTGQTRRLTDVGFRILGFFWDPNGQRIGYLIRQALPESTWMQWRVFDLAQNKDKGFTAFHPSFQMRFVIGSFTQYAQSHRFWSPDGRYLVYANRSDNGEEQVWLIDTRSDDGNNAILVDNGTIGFWSWN